jgi:hypothetical protein
LIEKFNELIAGRLTVEQATSEVIYSLNKENLSGLVWSLADSLSEQLLSRLKKSSKSLKVYCDGKICMGIKSGLAEAFVIDSETKAKILKSNKSAAQIIKPLVNGRDIRNYRIETNNLFLIYTYHGIEIEKYP